MITETKVTYTLNELELYHIIAAHFREKNIHIERMELKGLCLSHNDRTISDFRLHATSTEKTGKLS